MRTATVLWKDAAYFAEPAYGPKEKFHLFSTLSAGVIVEDTPEHISLALCFNPEQDERGHVLVIPKVLIVKIARHHKL